MERHGGTLHQVPGTYERQGNQWKGDSDTDLDDVFVFELLQQLDLS